jgi:hypothetical protein
VSKDTLYEQPLRKWSAVIERFNCDLDVEEAGKCLALDRHTAAVFHLMKVVESGVLALQCFLDGKRDPKAHFGSVLSKLETLNTKTAFADLPPDLKPYRTFLIDTLPHLHAVKDSWRNRVCHVDNIIVPTGAFTCEMAHNVYNCTLGLMSTMVEGLPPK